MTTTAKASTLQLQVNVPVDMEIKYIDVWPNDPSKDTKNGKGFGASVSLKGIVAGEEVRVYPKGFVNRTIEKLVNYGVIEDGNYQHDPAEKYSIPVKNGVVKIVNSQPAGERYANFDILGVNGNGKPPIAKTTSPAVSTSVYKASKPESELPPFLRDQEAEDRAELAAKIGEVPPELDRKATIAWAQKQSLAIVLEVYEPMFLAKNIGMTDDTVHKLSFELFKTWSDKGLIG